MLARHAHGQRLDRGGDRQRALAEDLHRVDLALVRGVVDRLDAISERVFEREEVTSLDVDELLVEIEQEGLASLLVDEELSVADGLDQRLRRRAVQSRL